MADIDSGTIVIKRKADRSDPDAAIPRASLVGAAPEATGPTVYATDMPHKFKLRTTALLAGLMMSDITAADNDSKRPSPISACRCYASLAIHKYRTTVRPKEVFYPLSSLFLTIWLIDNLSILSNNHTLKHRLDKKSGSRQNARTAKRILTVQILTLGYIWWFHFEAMHSSYLPTKSYVYSYQAYRTRRTDVALSHHGSNWPAALSGTWNRAVSVSHSGLTHALKVTAAKPFTETNLYE